MPNSRRYSARYCSTVCLWMACRHSASLWSVFADRHVLGVTVLQPRAGEDDLRVAIVLAQRLEQHEIAAAIHVEVGPRIFHAAHGAGLAREVHHDLLATDHARDQVAIAKVAFHHRDTGSLEGRGLFGVSAAIGRQNRWPCAKLNQFRREIDADEAQAADHQHARARAALTRLSSATQRPCRWTSDRKRSIVSIANKPRSCRRIQRSSPYIPPTISR